jgi:hypothetical protein
MQVPVLATILLLCFSLSSRAEPTDNEEANLEDASSFVLPPSKLPSYNHKRDPNEMATWSELVAQAAAAALEIAKRAAEATIDAMKKERAAETAKLLKEYEAYAAE